MSMSLNQKEKIIRIVKNVINKYDTIDSDARMMAEHIVRNLINSGLIKEKP